MSTGWSTSSPSRHSVPLIRSTRVLLPRMDQTKAIVPTARIIVGIRRDSRDDGGGPIPARLLRALQEIVQLLSRKDIRSAVTAIGDAPHHAAVR